MLVDIVCDYKRCTFDRQGDEDLKKSVECLNGV